MELINELPNEIMFNVFKYQSHPLADLYKQEMRNRWNKENIRLLNLYKTRLHLLETRNDNLELCRELKRVGEYEKQSLIRKYTELFNERIREYQESIDDINNLNVFDAETADEYL